MEKSEQQDNCNKYKSLLEQKADFKKRELAGEKAADMDDRFIQDDELEIKIAIEHHQLDLDQCKKSLQGQIK